MVKERFIFTVGYEGAPLVSFLGMLEGDGVAVLLDVRRDAFSRRPEFRKRAFEEALAAAGVAYRHEPRLGVPKEVREHFRGEVEPEGFAAWYAACVLEKNPALVEELAVLATSTPTALFCYEADPARCHRSLLARELARRTGLSVRHLTP